MSYYLILGYENAKLFIPHERDKQERDKSFEVLSGKRTQRNKMEWFEEPITVHQISNMLHVLFGERPVPSHRKVLYDKVDWIFEKANNSYLKIDTIQKYNKKKEKNEFVSELTQKNYFAYDSWNPNTVITWEIIRKYFNDKELFDEFVMLLNNNIKETALKKPFDQIQQIVSKTGVSIELKDFLIYNKRKSIVDYFNNRKNAYQITNVKTKDRWTAITNVRGINKCQKLSGEIAVPVNDGDLDIIQDSKGCATILDGGLVYIKEVIEKDGFIKKGHTKVSEISNKKIKHENKNKVKE